MKSLEIEIHDDDWEDFEWLPDDAWQAIPSLISINWSRVQISDPRWIMFVKLKYPWINWQDAV
jgi:hypothetical protein